MAMFLSARFLSMTVGDCCTREEREVDYFGRQARLKLGGLGMEREREREREREKENLS